MLITITKIFSYGFKGGERVINDNNYKPQIKICNTQKEVNDFLESSYKKSTFFLEDIQLAYKGMKTNILITYYTRQ